MPLATRTALYGLVVATLHLADIAFEPLDHSATADAASCVTHTSSPSLAAAAELLGLPDLAQLLTRRSISSGRRASVSVKPLSVADAQRTRAAIKYQLAMALPSHGQHLRAATLTYCG